MDERLAASLSHASRISLPMQLLLWEHGNEYTRANLARIRHLRDDISDQILAEGNEQLVSAWATSPRDGRRLRQAVRLVQGERALVRLAGQAQLTPAGIRVLAAKAAVMPGDSLAAALLDRCDVPARQRRELTVAYAMRNTWREWPGEIIVQRLGSDPATWAALMSAVGTDQVGLMRYIPLECLDDARVQQAAVQTCLRIGISAQERAMEAGLLRLLSSPTLSQACLQQLAAGCSGLSPMLRGILSESLTCDSAETLRAIGCKPGDRCPQPDHVSAIQDLVGQSRISWGRTSLPGSVLVHAEALPDAAIVKVLDQVNQGEGRALAAAVERSPAPSGEKVRMLALLGQDVSVPVIGGSDHARTAFRQLARAGCRELLEHGRVPAALHGDVVEEFPPVGDLLGNSEYSSLLMEQVAELAAHEQEMAWRLVEEWEGSLDGLRVSVKVLS